MKGIPKNMYGLADARPFADLRADSMPEVSALRCPHFWCGRPRCGTRRTVRAITGNPGLGDYKAVCSRWRVDISADKMSIKNNFYSARNPAIQFVTYVLSNGASLRMGIATAQAGPRYANLVSAWHGMGIERGSCA